MAAVRSPVTLSLLMLALATMSIGFISCDEEAGRDLGSVKIDGKWFHLELAADPDTRFEGLSGREMVEPDGGMLFVFPRPIRLHFVMRDCLIPIDIIFLDAAGRITAMHQMEVEEPRKADEPAPATQGTLDPYEARLKKYSSRFAAQYVIELQGGMLDSLNLVVGDKIDLDLLELKKKAS